MYTARIMMVCALSSAITADANVRLPPILSNHMVLVRSHDTPIWGKSDPGETVAVEIAGKTSSTVAGTDGRWRVHLDLADAATGPFQLTVKGRNQLKVSDVLVGAVWVAAGQSNMEMPLKGTLDAAKEIERSANAQLRYFRVPKIGRREPVEDCEGAWTLAGPETAGAYSAVAYYFAKRIQREIELPVGIIDASWSGTYSELWMSRDAIRSVDTLRIGEENIERVAEEYAIQKKRFATEYAAWLAATGREDRTTADPAGFAAENIATGDWSVVKLPGRFFDEPTLGVIWIRRDIDVPKAALETGRDFKVLLGDIEGFEQVYWNGSKVAETNYRTYPGLGYQRYFAIPPKLLRSGINTISVRIFAPGRTPQLTASPTRFWAGPIDLGGEWRLTKEYDLPPLSPKDAGAVPKAPRQPGLGASSTIFNGVVNPITSYGVDGVLWYQGESDTGRAYEYRTALRALITDWRAKWRQARLPFYLCQIHSYGPKKSTPGESAYAEVRESQASVLDLPETGMAVSLDVGESSDEHPRNKKVTGERLATVVLAKHYGRNLAYSGPIYESMRVEGEKIRVRFQHAEGGLHARPLPKTYDVNTLTGKSAELLRNSPDGPIEGFSICGEDRNWQWANAKIEGNAVVVWSNQVSHPIAVRYGWADFPTVNLTNAAGLPAAPFRTDDFEASTAASHYGT